jgi:hypothetical protein
MSTRDLLDPEVGRTGATSPVMLFEPPVLYWPDRYCVWYCWGIWWPATKKKRVSENYFYWGKDNR